jgi:hypothetical protein
MGQKIPRLQQGINIVKRGTKAEKIIIKEEYK